MKKETLLLLSQLASQSGIKFGQITMTVKIQDGVPVFMDLERKESFKP